MPKTIAKTKTPAVTARTPHHQKSTRPAFSKLEQPAKTPLVYVLYLQILYIPCHTKHQHLAKNHTIYKHLSSSLAAVPTDRSAMKKTTTSAFAAVLLLAMLAAMPARADDVSCSSVINDLSPCLDFLQGDAGQPSARCCDGVKIIYEPMDTTAARQATCECLKSAYNMINAELYAAQTLPGACGVPPSYTITPNFDCSQ